MVGVVECVGNRDQEDRREVMQRGERELGLERSCVGVKRRERVRVCVCVVPAHCRVSAARRTRPGSAPQLLLHVGVCVCVCVQEAARWIDR